MGLSVTSFSSMLYFFTSITKETNNGFFKSLRMPMLFMSISKKIAVGIVMTFWILCLSPFLQ